MVTATICKLSRFDEIEGAEKIKIGYALGNSVVVQIDTDTTTLGIYFPVDSQLSETFVEANNLYRRDPKTGLAGGGFFEQSRRVRAQKFMGHQSIGFWCPLDYLSFLNKDLDFLVEGYEFTELFGVPIVGKYYTPATLKAMQNKKYRKPLDVELPRHYDTENVLKAGKAIREDSFIVITEKLHGTSGATGNVPYIKYLNLNWFQRQWNKVPFLNKFPDKVNERTAIFDRTRNTILQDREDIKDGNSESYRLEVFKEFSNFIRPGEVFYYEIVGYDSCGSPIMASHSTSGLDKDFQKRFGKKVTYSYGCDKDGLLGERRGVYIYRITQLGFDGIHHELSWNQVEQRCKELGLKTVPVLDKMYVRADQSLDFLEPWWQILGSGPSTLDESHPKEGVCIRLENDDGIKVFKHKNFEFLVMEGLAKSNDDYVDTEESA